MKKEKLGAMNFIGKVFLPAQIDKNKSYAQQVQETENDPNFKKFLEKNGFTNQRASLIVFAPETFMFWYGVVTEKNIKQLPKQLNHFVLPSCEVAEIDTDNMNMGFFSQPLNFVIPTFLDKLAQTDVVFHENPGDSKYPYFLNTLNLSTKKLAQMLYLDASEQNN